MKMSSSFLLSILLLQQTAFADVGSQAVDNSVTPTEKIIMELPTTTIEKKQPEGTEGKNQSTSSKGIKQPITTNGNEEPSLADVANRYFERIADEDYKTWFWITMPILVTIIVALILFIVYCCLCVKKD